MKKKNYLIPEIAVFTDVSTMPLMAGSDGTQTFRKSHDFDGKDFDLSSQIDIGAGRRGEF